MDFFRQTLDYTDCPGQSSRRIAGPGQGNILDFRDGVARHA
jgi:hypothetical protein